MHKQKPADWIWSREVKHELDWKIPPICETDGRHEAYLSENISVFFIIKINPRYFL